MKEDYIEHINDNELRMFLNKSKSKIWIDSREEEVLVDFSWVDKVEECMPYMDKLIRNPKRFLIQEEEVINVEKSKKTTTETVRHLAQNSDLIENIAPDGMIQPKKVLNIQKEDTIDIYENRFLYTLLKNLQRFVDDQIEKFGDDGSYYKCDRKVSFEGEAKLQYDKIKYNVTLENNRYHEVPLPEEGQRSMEDRINEIRIMLSGFSKTEFVKSLVAVAPVRSPLRKTNLILKEPSFKKMAELWDFLERYQIIDPRISKKEETISDNNEIKNIYEFGAYVNFSALSFLDNKYERKESNLYNVAYIKNLIEDYLDEVGGSERTFTKMLKDQFKIVQRARSKRYKDIKRICTRFIQVQNNSLDKCEMLLK